MTQGWSHKKLGEVCVLQRGFDLPKGDRKSGLVPLISSSGRSDYHDEAKVKGPGVVTGRSGSIGKVFFIEEDFWPLNTTLYVKEFYGNYPRFVAYLLNSFDLSRYTSGAGVPTLNRNHVHDELVFVPESVEEQKRIVAILDQAFADIDQARANAETNLKIARELFDSYLDKVFSQRDDGWVISKIGEVAKVSYGYTEKAVHEKVGPHFLRITDIQDGYVDWTKVPYCTISETDYKKYKLMTGDIVFARTGATTGKSYLLDNPPESVAASYLIRLRLTCKDILPEYISLFFQTTSYWDNVKTGMTGSAQGGFNASKLSDLILAYPRNIERQIEICNELASLESHIQMLKAIYTKKLSLLNDLKKSILQTAFAGELTKSKGIAA